MPRYLLIESRDPFESRSFRQRCELAAALASGGSEVTVFLVENAVLAARAAADARDLHELGRRGVTLLADEFALRERGITTAQLSRDVRPAGLDALVAELGTGARAIWN
jgi:sulfur relay (sulfurtransferase) complex TusBCD TusD component (DsrE family)